MKHITFFATLLLTLGISLSACAKEKLIEFNKLPEKAQTFIKTNFPEATAISIILDQDGLDKDYTVNLNEGTCIEFDRKGNWESIKNMKGVDNKFLPAKAAEYIQANYAGIMTIEISYDQRDLDTYEVKLENHVELKFAKDGSFLGTDM